MKTILIISMSDIANDPRVMRQVLALSDTNKYEVDTLSLASGGFHINGWQYEFYTGYAESKYKRGWYLKTHQYDDYYKATFPHGALREYDLIIANDNDSLPIAFDVRGEAKILHDAHEFSPEQQSDFMWRFFMQKYRTWVCEKYLDRCDKILTVSDGVAEQYKNIYGVLPEVMTNAAPYVDQWPTEVKDKEIKIIHHGISNSPRKIETLIEMMDYLDDRFKLTLMLVDRQPSYTEKLKKMAWKNPNISFRKPVPMTEIVKETNQYDVGIFMGEPLTANLKYTLPNKFFEYVQARLMVAIGPSIEMMKIVNEHKLGIVSSDFTAKSMATKLNGLTSKEIYDYKVNSHIAASKLNSDLNGKRLREIVEELVGA